MYRYDGISLQNRRESNMDSLLIKENVVEGKHCLLAIVSDGVGSVADGGFASSVATRELGNWFDALTRIEAGVGLEMRNVVLELNRYIKELAEQQSLNTASTFTALLAVDGVYSIVHLGDTRVYAYESGEGLVQITRDQVSETGRLTGYIGKESVVFPEFIEGDMRGKTMLLCSDGLYKKATLAEIAALVEHWDWKTGTSAADAFLEMVTERGERDNITFAIICFVESFEE